MRRNQRQHRPKRVSPGLCAAVAALVLVCLGARAHAAAPSGGGRWVLASVPLRESGSGERDTRAWLPPSYDKPESATRHYPVVVFLHGWPGAEGNWPGQGRAGVTLGALIAAGRIPDVIGLFPDGTGPGFVGRSLWLDSWDGRARVETFVVRDMFAWADSAFRTRTDPADRAVIGLSDGATGAMNLLIRHPDVFGGAGGHSGDYLIERDMSNRRIFGPEPGASRLRAEASPLLTVAKAADHLRHASIYIDCGQDDEEITGTRALHARLDSLGVHHTYAEYPRGHDWTYWRTHLVQSLEAVTKGMR